MSLLLDASGSMEASRKPAVAAVNRYLARLHEEPAAARMRVSITFFNSHAIDAVRDREPVATCAYLEEAEYRPAGRTPLLDAIGYSAGLLDCLSKPDERRVFAILTDGQDTGSRAFTTADVSTLLLRNQREHGWVVLYLGIDHDSKAQGEALGVPKCWIADVSRSRFAAAADLLSDVARRYGDWPRLGTAGLSSGDRAALSA